MLSGESTESEAGTRHALSYAYIQSSQQQETFITIDYQHLSDELLASIRNVSDILPIIESITSTLQEKNHFLIPETECIPLQKLLHSCIQEDGILQAFTHREPRLSEYCKQELRNAAKLEINQLYSLSLQKIRTAYSRFWINMPSQYRKSSWISCAYV